jgi:hypothetical protein
MSKNPPNAKTSVAKMSQIRRKININYAKQSQFQKRQMFVTYYLQKDCENEQRRRL